MRWNEQTMLGMKPSKKGPTRPCWMDGQLLPLGDLQFLIIPPCSWEYIIGENTWSARRLYRWEDHRREDRIGDNALTVIVIYVWWQCMVPNLWSCRVHVCPIPRDLVHHYEYCLVCSAGCWIPQLNIYTLEKTPAREGGVAEISLTTNCFCFDSYWNIYLSLASHITFYFSIILGLFYGRNTCENGPFAQTHC
jgi:hypothetical protein